MYQYKNENTLSREDRICQLLHVVLLSNLSHNHTYISPGAILQLHNILY